MNGRGIAGHLYGGRIAVRGTRFLAGLVALFLLAAPISSTASSAPVIDVRQNNLFFRIPPTPGTFFTDTVCGTTGDAHVVVYIYQWQFTQWSDGTFEATYTGQVPFAVVINTPTAWDTFHVMTTGRAALPMNISRPGQAICVGQFAVSPGSRFDYQLRLDVDAQGRLAGVDVQR